ncbi:TetR/AcrR family transcriptional regulator [Pseudotabrizicola algicola]|uniref:TetR family transcriptional regulator n=1 Tax=Pseudotabrizicola algicola TaxID=2709381 RepID=A0A6B3RKS2_9RHOB|nr:TetR/AcrR family transcriptional regulator [Pseudotabrizicola algicola]NEX45836.1 TetR family transcriptional regulator [Pseudotabrizicola algicola]
MARPRTIDRETLLDAAERVVTRQGAAALSFASVATEAGLSKASVQSAFGSRDALIDALIGRWMAHEAARFRAMLAEETTPEARLNAHLRCTYEELHNGSGQRVASLLAILASAGLGSDSLRQWYQARIGDLTATTEAERQRRTAYLAAEGAYFLRCIVGLEADAAVWSDIFADLQAETPRD